MQDTLRIKINEAEITKDGILIKSMDIIDRVSGSVLRPSKLTPELLDFLKCVEIILDDYLTIQTLIENNKTFSKLVDTFKLYT